jgi:hypothetical protein
MGNNISCFGDVLTTACYVDTHNVFYDAVCSFRSVYSISPCKALVFNKLKMGDNVGILCNIIASCKNVSEFVYLFDVSNFNIARDFPAKAADKLIYIFCAEVAARNYLNCDVSIPGIGLDDYSGTHLKVDDMLGTLFGMSS